MEIRLRRRQIECLIFSDREGDAKQGCLSWVLAARFCIDGEELGARNSFLEIAQARSVNNRDILEAMVVRFRDQIDTSWRHKKATQRWKAICLKRALAVVAAPDKFAVWHRRWLTVLHRQVGYATYHALV
jgi:hypothetical protein